MADLEELKRRVLAFRDERDWAQFHTPKDLAMCMSIEAGELLELFLWGREVERERVREELADVINAALLLAAHYDIDVGQAVLDKLVKNAAKYPVETSRGNNAKYDQQP